MSWNQFLCIALALLSTLAMAPLAMAATEPGPADKDAPEEFTTTKSGLKYRIRRADRRGEAEGCQHGRG